MKFQIFFDSGNFWEKRRIFDLTDMLGKLPTNISGKTKESENNPELDKTRAALKTNDNAKIQSEFQSDTKKITDLLSEARTKYAEKKDGEEMLARIDTEIKAFNGENGRAKKLSDDLAQLLQENESVDEATRTARIEAFLSRAETELSEAIFLAKHAESADVGIIDKAIMKFAEIMPDSPLLLSIMEAIRDVLKMFGAEGILDKALEQKSIRIYGKEIQQNFAKKGIIFVADPTEIRTMMSQWRQEKDEKRTEKGFPEWMEECANEPSFKNLKIAIESKLGKEKAKNFAYRPSDFTRNRFDDKTLNILFQNYNPDDGENSLRSLLDGFLVDRITIARDKIKGAELNKKKFSELATLAKDPDNADFLITAKTKDGLDAQVRKMLLDEIDKVLESKYSTEHFYKNYFFATSSKGRMLVEVNTKPDGKISISYKKDGTEKKSSDLSEESFKIAMQFLSGDKSVENKIYESPVSDKKPKTDFGGDTPDAKSFWENAESARNEQKKDALKKLKGKAEFLGWMLSTEIPLESISKISDDEKSITLTKGTETLKITADPADKKLSDTDANFKLEPEPVAATPPTPNPMNLEKLKEYLKTWANPAPAASATP